MVMVAAYGDNRVIGADGEIPWRIPEDFAHFKEVTLGHTLVMGRATWDSIGRPLPGRTTVVLTRSEDWDPGFEGVHVVHSLPAALALRGDAARGHGDRRRDAGLRGRAAVRHAPGAHRGPPLAVRATLSTRSSPSTSGRRYAASRAPTSGSTGCGGSGSRRTTTSAGATGRRPRPARPTWPAPRRRRAGQSPPAASRSWGAPASPSA